MTAPRFDLDAIRERNPLENVVGQVVTLKRAGRRQRGACPFHVEKTPSFYVYGDGAAARFHCFGCGADGEVIGFVMRVQALTFVEACRMLTDKGGLDDPRVLDAARERARRQKEAAAQADADRREAQRLISRRIWGETERIATQFPALGYYDRRGIVIARLPDGRLPPDIRYHPGLEYWWTPAPKDQADRPRPIILARRPALVSAVRSPSGHGLAVEIKYLESDGRKAELVDPETGELLTHKKMRGNPWGGAIHLAPAARTMGFGEGMETCLSVMCADPRLPVWAGLSIGNLAGGGKGRGRRIVLPPDPRTLKAKYRFLESPIPDIERPALMPPAECRRAILLEDADNADPDAAAALYARAAARWTAAGHDVRRARPPEGMDFNDVLKREAA